MNESISFDCHAPWSLCVSGKDELTNGRDCDQGQADREMALAKHTLPSTQAVLPVAPSGGWIEDYQVDFLHDGQFDSLFDDLHDGQSDSLFDSALELPSVPNDVDGATSAVSAT